VPIEDVESGERKSFVVGSHQVLDQQHDDEIPYAAPLAGPFLGARPAKSASLRSATGRHCSASSASSSGQENDRIVLPFTPGNSRRHFSSSRAGRRETWNRAARGL
jgi:hypothetical protein